MVNRLTPQEAMFYFLDDARSTTHLGALMIITPDPERPALDYSRLVTLVENRLQAMPRHRQVVREVVLGLGRPVWADDAEFDINFHIRRSGLPAPGGAEQLEDLIARVMSRPLDRTRPLWEMYLIEGLADGKLAVLTKSHRCLLDADRHHEISEIVTDDTPTTEPLDEDLWMPGAPPGSLSLAMGALTEVVSRPAAMVQSVARGEGLSAEIRSTAEGTMRWVGQVVQQLADAAPSSALNAPSTPTRMFTVATVPRRECAKIADRYGCTVNDVILAILCGVLRRWRLSVDEAIATDDTVRVALPLSSRDPSVERRIAAAGQWIAVGRPGFVTDLPTGEDNPSMRLVQVAGLADRYSQSARRVSMGLRPMFPELGVIPFPEFSSRAFTSMNRRNYNVPISMGSGPVSTRYLAGHEVTEMFAVPLFIGRRALAISVVEYRGDLSFGFIGDRGVIHDLPIMSAYVTESYEELLATK